MYIPTASFVLFPFFEIPLSGNQEGQGAFCKADYILKVDFETKYPRMLVTNATLAINTISIHIF